MKHNYFIRLAIIAMMLWPISMKAADPVRVHGIYYELIGDEATVTSGSITYSGVLAIPSSFNYSGRTYHVTSIGYQAFYNRTDLISVTIPESVISIDVSAFAGCSGLTTISIPDNLTIICDGAFIGCSRLSSVTIGTGLTSLGTGVFNNCVELSSIKVKAENKCFDSRNNCNAIIETSSNKLVAGCNKTIIPNDVTSIEFNAFYGCSHLNSITIPNSVKFIGHHAFSGCSGMTSVSIGSGVTIISDNAFSGCSGMTSVSIGSGVTGIGSSSFSNCSGLTSITIPNNVESIGNSAFSGCSGMTSVSIGSGVTIISDNAFSGCSGLTSITIPNNIESIGNNAFSGCSGLTSVTIGRGVTSIGASAFSGCSGLASIKVEGGNNKYDSRNNCNAIIQTATNTLIAGCKNTFIPSNVTSIGSSAFSGCIGLTSINIPEGVTSIGSSAFSGCSSMSYVIIPSTIISIGDMTFASCTSLKDFYCYAEGLPYIMPSYYNYGYHYDCFNNTPLSSVMLHVPEASIYSYRSTEPWSSFGSIVALTDEDGIANMKADEDAIWNVNATTDEPNPVFYDTNGRQSDRPHHGINIIRYSDGTTKKVLMK